MIRDQLCRMCRRRFKYDRSAVEQGHRCTFLGGTMTSVNRVCAECIKEEVKKDAVQVPLDEVEAFIFKQGDTVVGMVAQARGIVFAVYGLPSFKEGETTRKEFPFVGPEEFAKAAASFGLVPLDPGSFGAVKL